MGALLSRLKGTGSEWSLHSRIGRWAQRVSTQVDELVSDVAALVSDVAALGTSTSLRGSVRLAAANADVDLTAFTIPVNATILVSYSEDTGFSAPPPDALNAFLSGGHLLIHSSTPGADILVDYLIFWGGTLVP